MCLIHSPGRLRIVNTQKFANSKFALRATVRSILKMRGGGLGSRPQKMYGERLGDEVEYHLMKPTPRR